MGCSIPRSRTYPLKHLKKWLLWPWADLSGSARCRRMLLFTSSRNGCWPASRSGFTTAKEVVVGYGTSAPPADAERQRHAFLQRFPQLQGKRILLFLSRIHPKKGVDLLIEAFAAVAPADPSLQLVIAGPDQVGWQESLQQRAAELGIAERITWPGMLSGELQVGRLPLSLSSSVSLPTRRISASWWRKPWLVACRCQSPSR